MLFFSSISIRNETSKAVAGEKKNIRFGVQHAENTYPFLRQFLALGGLH
jgi:hypothetical protein